MSVRHQWSHYTAATLHKRLCEKIKLTPWCDQKSFVKNINVESHIYLDLLERSLNATYPCIADATVHVLTKGYNLPRQLSVKLTCFYFFIVCDVPSNISKDIIQSSPSSKLHDSRPHQYRKLNYTFITFYTRDASRESIRN